MADDVRISVALPRHPKTVKLERRLGAEGFRGLIWLFLWVGENRPDGSLRGMTAEDVEIAADWKGQAGQFVSALSEVQFLDGEAGEYRIHDWAEHNPWAAGRPARIAAAKIAAKTRWQLRDSDPDAARMRTACDSHESAMPHSPPLTTPQDVRSKACVRPTLEEVTVYCRERGGRVDPQQWFDHYTANGWRVGKNPMKDWRAAVRTWERNGVDSTNGNRKPSIAEIVEREQSIVRARAN